MSQCSIMRIDYTQPCGPYNEARVALFDIHNISEAAARRCIFAGEYNKNIIDCTKEQYESVFSSMLDKKGESL